MTLIPFNYNEQQLRVIEIDGEPWFIPADACAILGHSNASQAVAQHVHADDVKRATLTIREGSRDVTRERTLVNESGLYALIFGSTLPQAVEFKRWITSEVLPSIRKTGSYGAAAALTEDQIVAQALAITTKRIEALTATVEQQGARLRLVEPKAEAFDRWLSSNVDYSVGHVAKALDITGVRMGRQRLFAKLSNFGWIFRNPAGQWEPYQTQIKARRLSIKLGAQLNTRTGEQFATVTVRITPKGAAKLATLLGAMPEAVAEALATTEDEAAA